MFTTDVNKTRFDIILENFRRRDNIRDWIDGLQDTECWPYPGDESRSIPATFEDSTGQIFVQANLHEDKVHELLRLYLTDVRRSHPNLPWTKGICQGQPFQLADVSIHLCPEEGPGAYEVSYEKADEAERAQAPKLDLECLAVLRWAFMHRCEWVFNKLDSVNRDRREACQRIKRGDYVEEEPEPNTDSENEEPLEEEEDVDFCTCGDCHEPEGDNCEDEYMVEDYLLSVVKAHNLLVPMQRLPGSEGSATEDLMGCAPMLGPREKPPRRSPSIEGDERLSGTMRLDDDAASIVSDDLLLEARIRQTSPEF